MLTGGVSAYNGFLPNQIAENILSTFTVDIRKFFEEATLEATYIPFSPDLSFPTSGADGTQVSVAVSDSKGPLQHGGGYQLRTMWLETPRDETTIGAATDVALTATFTRWVPGGPSPQCGEFR